MRANLTTRDYEMLSAYIDGQLAPGEQRKLEERLRARPELQVALDELKRTRLLLRQAPRRRAPRNFTLTPAMVGEQRRKPAPWAGWFPVLSFTSALAALALVVTIVLQFAPPGTTSQTVAMQPPAAAMESAPQAEPMMKKQENAAPQEATQAADSAAGSAPAGAAPEAARGMAAQPTTTSGPAVLPAYEATAQAFGEPTQSVAQEDQPGETPGPAAAMAAPEQPAPTVDNLTATAPPVIQWDSANPYQGKGSATGMGGAGGMGGGGEGPSLGPLMGPPPSPEANSTTGLGGGAPDGSMALPPEVMMTQAVEATPGTGETPSAKSAAGTTATEAPAPTAEAAGTPVAELPAAPAENTGPILGVPGAGEGGQIMERKSIQGNAEVPQSSAPAAGQPGANQPLVGEQPQRGPLGLQPWALTILQLILALLAIAAGVTAYLLRLRRTRR